MSFTLHPNLASKIFIIDFPLSRVLLENEQHYPWLILVPRRRDKIKWIDLSMEDQQQLLMELNWVQTILWEQFNPTQLNVAAIGNKTPQLHIHVLARKRADPAWPGTVWDHPVRQPYRQDQKVHMVELLEVLCEKKLNTFSS